MLTDVEVNNPTLPGLVSCVSCQSGPRETNAKETGGDGNASHHLHHLHHQDEGYGIEFELQSSWTSLVKSCIHSLMGKQFSI